MRVKGPQPLEVLPVETEPTLTAILQAMQLKRLYRQGWLKREVGADQCESVADHSLITALLALLAPADSAINRERAALLALVHELGEVWAGDITPVDGVDRAEKARRERSSVDRVLGKHPEAGKLRALWEEFEAGESPEAQWVRQLDRLEMGIQAAVYRAEGHARMEEFLDSADRAVTDEALRSVLYTIRNG